MKKIFSFIALAFLSVAAFAQDCETVPSSFTGNASITFQRYTQKLLPGVFSVAAGKYVRFSQGNLQYKASTNKWRFAENQWDCIGDANVNVSSTYGGWIDLFGFGCSGWDGTSATEFLPYSTSSNNDNYLRVSISGERVEADWAYHNPIINGGVEGVPAAHQWRAMTSSEWAYLFKRKDASDNVLYAYCTLMGTRGIILLPDTWSWSEPSVAAAATAYGFSFNPGRTTGWTTNVIENTESGIALWNAMENAGAVFLPTTGYRSYDESDNVVINYSTSACAYWTRTMADATKGLVTYITSANLNAGISGFQVRSGMAVRAVRDL